MISVIVVNWDKKELLKLCLDSLKKQAFKDFEIVVVDNGSTDGSAEFVKESFPEVKIIALNENTGFSRGNNIGIKSSSGEFVALLNNDAEAHPRWLEELYLSIRSRPEIGMCASKILCDSDREIIDTAGDIFWTVGTAKKRGEGKKDRGEFDSFEKIFSACAGAALYRRNMLEDIGFFDEDFSPACYEDIDLSFRAQLKGYQCLYVPTAKVYHKVSSTIGKDRNKHIYLCARNISYVVIKNMPASLLIRYSLNILIFTIGSFIKHLFRGEVLPYLFGKAAALKMAKVMLEKRRKIQTQRRVPDEYIDSILS